MQRFFIVITLAIFSVVHVVALGKITEEAKKVPQAEGSAATLPLPILRITALDYDGLASDFLFLKSLVFLGSTFERKDQPRVKDLEWKWLYHTLEASAALDPYFLDPYYFANANLTWEGKMYQETNTLLEKGARARYWDHLLPFYIGFNYFYFLQEYEKAGEFLMEASRRSGAAPIYASLAAKMAFKEKKTETAIMFLEEILSKTEDELMKKEYQNRIEALKGIYDLEQAVAVFKKRFGRLPKNLDELQARHIISSLPRDPYGGGYSIDAQGNIRATSESLLLPHQRTRP